MEIVFSIVQRKVLSPNDFDEIDVVVERLAGGEPRYHQAAKPFEWKFTTTTDLTDLMDRLDQHRPGGESPGRGDKRRARGIEEMALWWHPPDRGQGAPGVDPSAS